MAISDGTVEVYDKTVEHYMYRIAADSTSDTLANHAYMNAKRMRKMSPEDCARAKEILAQEHALSDALVNRYKKRATAVSAKDKTLEQKRLMTEYNLVSERLEVTVLTLGFNQLSNHDAEQKAVRRDAAEIAAEMNYAPKPARDWLARKGIQNFLAV